MTKKFIYFEDEIENDPVLELVETLQEVEEDSIELWFSTDGGSITLMAYLIAVLNEVNKTKPIKIVCVLELKSAGTYLLCDYEGELVLSKELDRVVMHTIDRAIYLNRGSNKDRIEAISHVDESNKDYLEKFDELLAPKEIARFKAGKDVNLYSKDFDRINNWRNKRLKNLL